MAALVAGAAEQLGLGAGSGVVRAALLHDIGKLGLSNRILDKPGPLTPREWTAVRAHPLQTEAVLQRADALRPIAAIAGAHHERLDGSGYPRGLHRATSSRSPPGSSPSPTSTTPWSPAARTGRRWGRSSALARMEDEARTGRLDADCVDALAAFARRPGREHGAPTVGYAGGEHPAQRRRHVQAVHPRLGRRHGGGGALLAHDVGHGVHDAPGRAARRRRSRRCESACVWPRHGLPVRGERRPGLRHGGDPRGQRDEPAGQARRPAGAVPPLRDVAGGAGRLAPVHDGVPEVLGGVAGHAARVRGADDVVDEPALGAGRGRAGCTSRARSGAWR